MTAPTVGFTPQPRSGYYYLSTQVVIGGGASTPNSIASYEDHVNGHYTGVVSYCQS